MTRTRKALLLGIAVAVGLSVASSWVAPPAAAAATPTATQLAGGTLPGGALPVELPAVTRLARQTTNTASGNPCREHGPNVVQQGNLCVTREVEYSTRTTVCSPSPPWRRSAGAAGDTCERTVTSQRLQRSYTPIRQWRCPSGFTKNPFGVCEKVEARQATMVCPAGTTVVGDRCRGDKIHNGERLPDYPATRVYVCRPQGDVDNKCRYLGERVKPLWTEWNGYQCPANSVGNPPGVPCREVKHGARYTAGYEPCGEGWQRRGSTCVGSYRPPEWRWHPKVASCPSGFQLSGQNRCVRSSTAQAVPDGYRACGTGERRVAGSPPQCQRWRTVTSTEVDANRLTRGSCAPRSGWSLSTLATQCRYTRYGEPSYELPQQPCPDGKKPDGEGGCVDDKEDDKKDEVGEQFWLWGLTADELLDKVGYVRCPNGKYASVEPGITDPSDAECGLGVGLQQVCEDADAAAVAAGELNPDGTQRRYRWVDGGCKANYTPVLHKVDGSGPISTTCSTPAGFLGSRFWRNAAGDISDEVCVYDYAQLTDAKTIRKIAASRDYTYACPGTSGSTRAETSDNPTAAGQCTKVTKSVCEEGSPKAGQAVPDGQTKDEYCGDDKVVCDEGSPKAGQEVPDGQTKDEYCGDDEVVCEEGLPKAGQVVPEGQTKDEYCGDDEVCDDDTYHRGKPVEDVNGNCNHVCEPVNGEPAVTLTDPKQNPATDCPKARPVCQPGTDRAGELVGDRPCNDPQERCPDGTDRAGELKRGLPCDDPEVEPDQCDTPPVLTAADVDDLLGVSTVWGEQTFPRFAAFAARGPSWADGVSVVLGAPALLLVDPDWSVEDDDGCTWVAEQVRWQVARFDPRGQPRLARWWDQQATLVHVIADEGDLPPAPATATWERELCAAGSCPEARVVPPQVPFVQRWPIASTVTITLTPTDGGDPQPAELPDGGSELVWLYHHTAYSTILTVP